MRSMLRTGLLVLTSATMPLMAQAGTLEGAAIGAGTGAVIAGPPGAVVGGVVGAVVGGPNVVHRRSSRGERTCWRGRDGYRHCAWR